MIFLNKFEANLALLSVTLCWGIQYLFYQSIPESVSVFGFMTLTNGLGLLILCLVFFNELKNIQLSSFFKGFLLSFLSLITNVLLALGSKELSASTTAFAATLYVVVIPVMLFIFYKERIQFGNLLAMICVVLGLAIATGLSLSGLLQKGILQILIADIAFAGNILLLDYYAKTSAPSHLAVTQMLFGTILSFIIWIFIQPTLLIGIENHAAFWSSVFVIALFVRAYSTVMQIYAQRYAAPFSASLIFSTEIVFTIIFSIFLPLILGRQAVYPSVYEIIGCIILVAGVIISNLNIPKFDVIIKIFINKFKEKNSITVLVFGSIVYMILNLCFRQTFVVIPVAGPCAILFAIMGTIYGVPGILSVCIGSVLSDLLAGTLSGMTIFSTVSAGICTGFIYLWNINGYSVSINMKSLSSIARLTLLYIAACFIASVFILLGQNLYSQESNFFTVFLLFFLWGTLFGFPVLMLLLSVFGLSPLVLNKKLNLIEEKVFTKTIENTHENISILCEELSLYCEEKNLDFKRSYNVVLAVEEMLVNIIENAFEDKETHEINVTVKIKDVIFIQISNQGKYFNPVNFKKKTSKSFSLRSLFKGESLSDPMDMLGIIMVTKTAIKVEHKLQNGKNILTILI